MSYDYQGPASVIIVSHHLGTGDDGCVKENVNIEMTSSDGPTIVHLNFEAPLKWPGHPNVVTVNLPDGTSVSGVITELERSDDKQNWVKFTVEK
jgi:hypothetical protein